MKALTHRCVGDSLISLAIRDGLDPAQEVNHGHVHTRNPSRTSRDLRAGIAFLEGGPLKIATLEREPILNGKIGLERACLCARIATENKGRDVKVLDMRGITPLYDYFVLATGASRRQIHTLAEEIDAAMHSEGEKRLSIEGYQASRWVVQDYGDVVVHIFDGDARKYFALEDLWADAEQIDWERF